MRSYTSLMLSLLLASFVTNAQDGDFPTGECVITVQDQESRWYDRALDVVPDIIDECALGPINQGISRSVGRMISKIDLPDVDFFCGWGTKDVWQEVTKDTPYEEFRNFEQYVNKINTDLRNRRDPRQIPIPGVSSRLPDSSVYKHIFKVD